MPRPLDLADPDMYAHGIPHEQFRALRRDTPVSWQAERGGAGFWAVTRYRDVITVLRDPQTFSSWRGGALLADPPPEFLEKLREGMLNRDPPDHTRLRQLVNHAFNPRRVADLEARVERQAGALVAAITPGTPCDFANATAGPLPLFVICEILGVPERDRARLYALTARMFGSELADPAAALNDALAAAGEIRGYGAELGLAKRDRPADDLASELLAAEVDGRRLTDGEFQAFFMLLFNAGADTTRSLLCLGLDTLLDHPESLARLRAEPALLETAIEEMLRFEPPVIQFRRTATRPVTLGDAAIEEGQKVVVFFPSANRDELVFREPDTFDIARDPNPHLAFGYGTHYCLGAPLARLEARHLFRALFARFGKIERLGPLVTSRTNFIRSATRLDLIFS